MEKNKNREPKQEQKSARPDFLSWLWLKVCALFEPEVVEVTFTQEGNYTYTKVAE